MKSLTTLANLLTLCRLLTIAPLYVTVIHGLWFSACSLFLLAIFSDLLDGKIARARNEATVLGGFFDHATDALLVTVGCLALTQLDLINPWLVALIPAAFIQYALDSKTLAGRTLRTSSIGKANGIAYFALLGIGIGGLTLQSPLLLAGSDLLAWCLTVTTVLSMADRLLALRQP